MADVDLAAYAAWAQARLEEYQGLSDSAISDIRNIAQGHLTSLTFSDIPDFNQSTKYVNYTPADASITNTDTLTVPTAVGMPAIDREADVIPLIWDPLDLTLRTKFDPEAFDVDAFQALITSDSNIIALTNKIASLLDSPAIVSGIQSALLSSMGTRDTQTYGDVTSRVRQENTMSGWPRASELHEASEAELSQKYSDTTSKRSNEMIILVSEQANKTFVAALNSGAGLNEIKSKMALEGYAIQYGMQSLILDKFNIFIKRSVDEVGALLKKIQNDYVILAKKADTTLDLFSIAVSLEDVKFGSNLDVAIGNAKADIKSGMNTLTAAERDTVLQVQRWTKEAEKLITILSMEIKEALRDNELRLAASETVIVYWADLISSIAQTVNSINYQKQ